MCKRPHRLMWSFIMPIFNVLFEFAEDCGISRTLLSLIETCKENVTIDTMELLSAYMGITISDLFRDGDVYYVVVPSKVIVDGVVHTAYGIGTVQNNVLIDCVLDVSVDFEAIRRLVFICNKEKLSLIHLRDVAEDFIIT